MLQREDLCNFGISLVMACLPSDGSLSFLALERLGINELATELHLFLGSQTQLRSSMTTFRV